jgi:hypothetical protein
MVDYVAEEFEEARDALSDTSDANVVNCLDINWLLNILKNSMDGFYMTQY